MRDRLMALLKVSLRIALSIGLLAWLLSKADPKAVLKAFLDISPGTWLTAVTMFLLLTLIGGTRWYTLARSLDLQGRWKKFVGYYFIGLYFNLFLPTSIGGDVFKVLFISRGEQKKLRATYSVVADRIFGLAAMLLLGAGAVVLNSDLLPPHFVHILLLAGATILFVLACLPLVHRFIQGIWPEIGQRLAIVLTFWKRPKIFFIAISLSIVLQTIAMGIIAMLAASMGLPPPASFYFAAFPLVAVITLLPVSFNGIGIREGGFVYFLSLKGVPADKAITLSLSFFVVQITVSLLGGIAYALGFHKRPIGNM